jgi:hypothetical protein
MIKRIKVIEIFEAVSEAITVGIYYEKSPEDVKSEAGNKK